MSKNSPLASTSETGAERRSDPRRYYALAVILLPVMLISLNTYMIQVALPSMQKSLNASFAEAQLVVTGFSLGLAVALIISGKLGDRYGRKRMLLIGVSAFTVMAALGGLISEPGLLIAVRLLQGLAAALIQPQVLSTLHVSFLPKEKPLVFGIYGAVIGAGFAFGLILGGMIVNWDLFGLGWRTVFFFNVPFGLLVLLLLPILPETRNGRAQSIDWTGASLLATGLFLLVYPLSEGQKRGWPFWTWGCLLMALTVLLVFILVEARIVKRRGSPLVDPSIFKHRFLSMGMAAVIVVYLSMFSFFFVLSYYLQFGLHYPVQATSLFFLPIGAGFFFTSLISSRIVRRLGMVALKSGALMMAGCCLLLIGSLYEDRIHLLQVQNIIILLIYGSGLGLVTTPLINVVLGAVPAEHAGTGSGLFTTFMYLANSLGVALIGMVFSASLGHSLDEAGMSDYVRAFALSLTVSGAFAMAAFVCLCLLHERK